MGSRGTPLPDKLRNPEYTGENRCIPCTVLNGILAVALTAAATAFGPVAAVVVLVASLASIYYRGYLVPGTPELTKRYLPDRVLRLFGKSPPTPREGWEQGSTKRPDPKESEALEESGDARETAPDAGEPEFETVKRIRDQRENAVDPVEFLLDVGVVEPIDGGEDLALESEFAETVDSHVSSLESGEVRAETLAAMFGVSPSEIAFEDRAYPAVTVLRRVRKWPGDGAYLADVASHLALADRTDRWLEVPAEQRLSILQSLRSFLSSCPVCGGDVAATADTVESCCLAHEVVAIRCESCGEHILELDPEKVATPGADTGVTP